jgi:hypothetical protein
MVTQAKVRTIGLAEAMTMLVETKARVVMFGKDIPCVQIPEPFTLIVVATGTQGSGGEAGDWIVWHPDGYPTIVADGVMSAKKGGDVVGA